MIVVPAATAEFDYRYVLPAVPFACLAAVMAFSRGTAGRAGLRDLADAARRTAGASRTAPGSGTVADSGAGSAADAGSASAAAGAGDDQRNLATDGA